MNVTNTDEALRPNPLVLFSHGKITKNQAIRDLNLRGYAELILEMDKAHLPIPRLSKDVIDDQVDTFVRLWTTDPDILGGTPVFKGTRVPVAVLFENLAGGLSLDEILDSYPSISRVHAIEALHQANINILASNQAKLLTKGIDLGNTMAKVDADFGKTFAGTTTPILEFGKRFSDLTKASQEAIRTAMLNNAIHREQFADDAAALASLQNAAKGCEGQLCAIQALSDIASTQVLEGQKLRDLMTQQNNAMNAVLSNKLEQGKNQKDANEKIWKPPFKQTLSTGSGEI